MKQAPRDILIGLTAIVGAGALAAMLLMFGEISLAQAARYRFTLRLDHAGGLSRTSPVRLNGVRVGEVAEIRNAADPRDGVELVLAIDQGIRVPRDAAVEFDRGFVGDTTLSLVVPRARPADDPGFIGPGETIERSGRGMMDMIGSLFDKHLKGLDQAAESFRQLSDTYTRVGQRAEELLAPRTVAEVEGGKPANLMSTLARLDAAVTDARKWVGDDSLRHDAREAISKAADLFNRAGELVDSWTRAAGSLTDNGNRISANIEGAARDFAALTRNLGEALHEIRGIAGRINAGEGTLGQLVTNPDLYRSLDDAAKRLEKALTEAQLLIEKYRKEGIPIQW